MTVLRLLSPRVLVSITVAGAVMACGGKDSTAPAGPTPASLGIVAGDNQSGVVGQALAQPLVVKVTDRGSAGVKGATVSWAIAAGGGSLSATSSQTDAQGQTQVTWTLGVTPGVNQLGATVVGLTPVSLTATGVSPGSGKIAFVSGSDIYTMNPSGTGVAQLTRTGDVSAVALSPDGSRLAFVRTISSYPGWGIYVVHADGSAAVRITASNEIGYAYSSLSWSPDGTGIAFDRMWRNIDDIYAMSADGTGLRRVTDSTTLRDEPTWSPDGMSLAFRVFGPGCSGIDVINVDGTGLKGLTDCVPQSHQYFLDPAWSPDGKKIALVGPQSSTSGDSTSIYLMNADGSGLTRLTNTPGTLDRYPAWSPDGSKIAFVRGPYNNLGISFIYTMNADGTGVVALRAGGSPTWGR